MGCRGSKDAVPRPPVEQTSASPSPSLEDAPRRPSPKRPPDALSVGDFLLWHDRADGTLRVTLRRPGARSATLVCAAALAPEEEEGTSLVMYG